MAIAIKAENLSKAYQLGEFSTGTISRDIERWWSKIRGKEDPFLKIGQTNDRTKKGSSDVVWSLKDVSFEIKQGDAVGIIGRNGAGKSTLLKLLSRVTSPTSGDVRVKGRIASLLEVGTGFHPELTGRENIFLNGAILGMRKHEIKSQFDEIIDFAGVERYIDTPVKRYSSGMYVRLAFAVAAHLESEILVVDEVLAVGDLEFQNKCLSKMGEVSKGEGKTVLLVSHNMASIKKICKECILLDNGKILTKERTDIAINQYLNIETLESICYFKKNLTYVKIEQVGAKIRVEAEFVYDQGLLNPHLGIVFKNSEGFEVFGTNPTIENQVLKIKSKNGGKIIIDVFEPRLNDGVYYVSVWFGSKYHDFIEAPSCLKIKVEGMSDNFQMPSSVVGNVTVRSKWQIIEY